MVTRTGRSGVGVTGPEDRVAPITTWKSRVPIIRAAPGPRMVRAVGRVSPTVSGGAREGNRGEAEWAARTPPPGSNPGDASRRKNPGQGRGFLRAGGGGGR